MRAGRWDVEVVIILAVVLLGGCAWRTAASEHYFGPVLFRYSLPADTGPATGEVVAVGLLGEAGRQWGLSLGVVERTAVTPRFVTGGAGSEPPPRRWSTPLSPQQFPVPGRWHLSLLYLRVDGVQPPGLVARRLHGLQMVVGAEARAVSLGMTSVTRVELPDDAIAIVRYDARAPLAARFSVWRIAPDTEVPWTEIVKEANP